MLRWPVAEDAGSNQTTYYLILGLTAATVWRNYCACLLH
ncbi:hypothetical protein Hsw_2375 [Hymenobacter swuensis DY53]|uniref:Uncharacterized protein n=1 Tax=Hymenobacter swuensis DY53 TaxID=1227739 RepID=W8F8E6_9BACT|nr:hypothetical protein Hsw_2375 [Hymenobacter swuensis DY53]